jgi:hypothetical protein
VELMSAHPHAMKSARWSAFSIGRRMGSADEASAIGPIQVHGALQQVSGIGIRMFVCY